MEEATLKLTKVDGEINVVTVTETLAPLSVEELDRQIIETESRLETLKKTRQAICDFRDSTKQDIEVTISDVTVEEPVSSDYEASI